MFRAQGTRVRSVQKRDAGNHGERGASRSLRTSVSFLSPPLRGPRMTERRRRPRRAVAESPLSATWRPAVRERAVLVGLGRQADEAALDELAALAETAGASPVARVVQTRSNPDPAPFVGKGKMAE